METIPNNPGRTMFRYYQQSEYDIWRVSQDSNPNDIWGFAKSHSVARLSNLCVSEDLDINKDPSQIEYAGPLFFDIDDKDLSVALKSGNQLVAKLLAIGVREEDIECHLSGSKGVHIYIDQRVFTTEASCKLLPEIYSSMAMHLWVEGMDFQVYSGGKGRMLRPPNAQRPDKAYKVQLTVDELRLITVDEYADLVAEPRPVLPKSEPVFCNRLAKLFTVSKEAVLSPKPKFKPVPIDALAKLGAEVPSCVEMLAQGLRKKARGERNSSFNAVAMQVGCWSKTSIVDEVSLQTIQERIAKNNPSSSGESTESRLKKLQAMHAYLATQEQYSFSCGGIKKLIEGSPSCSTCPLYNSEEIVAPIIEALYLVENQGHYYSDRDKSILLATFAMERESIIVDEDTMRTRTSTVLVKVPLSGATHRLVGFSEDAWISKQNFKKEMAGLDGVSFLGSDNDVARLKQTLVRNDLLNSGEINQVFAARTIGMLYRRRYGAENPRDPTHVSGLVYIEPGFSINDVGIVNSHEIISSEPPAGAPKMRVRKLDEQISEKANRAFSLLLKTNEPHVVSTMLGWFLASHLKAHYYAIEHRFPLLCIAGIAGTGKNSSVAVFMRLAGVEGEKALLTLEAPQSTQFPFQQALSDSTTIPRVINEMNPKSVTQRHYRNVIELLKAAFDSQHVSRGRVGGGERDGINVSTSRWKITAPVVVLSEEPIEDPAVLHRALMLHINPEGLLSGRQAFHQLEPIADDLSDIGRALIQSTLKTKIQHLTSIFDSTGLPDEVQLADIPERVKYSYKVILSAYEWATTRLETMGLSEENVQGLREMREHFKAYILSIVDSLLAEASITEIDLILRDLAILANKSSIASEGSSKLERGYHFAVQDGKLYLDVLMSYPVLKSYKRHMGDILKIQSPQGFLKMVKSMAYYISESDECPLLPTQGRPVLSLDMDKMATKGIPAVMFN